MVQPNELRIGNWVIEETLGLTRVWGLSAPAVEVVAFAHLDASEKKTSKIFSVSPSEVSPIQLTLEMIEKSGFELYDTEVDDYEDDENELIYTSYRKWKAKHLYYTICNIENGLFQFAQSRAFDHLRVDEDCHVLATLQYVHELQNLYFMLTKKELQVDFSTTSNS